MILSSVADGSGFFVMKRVGSAMCVLSMLLLVQISVFVNVLASLLTPALKRSFSTYI